jgi:hypothetical protein
LPDAIIGKPALPVCGSAVAEIGVVDVLSIRLRLRKAEQER